MLEKATLAHYLKITKKAFIGLKLAAQITIHENQADEIADLFAKKRFFNILRVGTDVLAFQRRDKQKASIFRFLSLLRKTMQGLKGNIVATREKNLKDEMAYRLYFRAITRKSLSILKAYSFQRKQLRLQRQYDDLHMESSDLQRLQLSSGQLRT